MSYLSEMCHVANAQNDFLQDCGCVHPGLPVVGFQEREPKACLFTKDIKNCSRLDDFNTLKLFSKYQSHCPDMCKSFIHNKDVTTESCTDLWDSEYFLRRIH